MSSYPHNPHHNYPPSHNHYHPSPHHHQQIPSPAPIHQQPPRPQPTFTPSPYPLYNIFISVYYYIISPFFLALYESLALWRVVPFVSQSQQLRRWIRNCIALNGVVFLGSLFFYSLILGPTLELILTWGNFHPGVTWWGSKSALPLDPSEIAGTDQQHYWSTTLALFEGLYHISWTIPIWIVSMVANSFFHNKISEEVFRIRSNQLKVVHQQQQQQQLDLQRNSPPMSDVSALRHHTPAQQHPFQPQQEPLSHQTPPQQSQPQSYHQQHHSEVDDPAPTSSLEVNISPIRLFAILTEQLSRILIFIFLLLQATVLSFIPDILSVFIPAAAPNPTPIQHLTATVFTFLKNIPLILSYALTSISYTYAMFEFSWTSPNLTQLYKKTTFTKTQLDIMNQLHALRGEHDMSQLNCRFKYVEGRMAYFFGFSIILTLATFHLSLLTSISLFGLLFPINLLSSLVAHGHIDLLDKPLFPKQPPTGSTTQTTPTQTPNQQPQQSASAGSKRVVIPPNTSPANALYIIYTAHDLTIPPQLPIFGIARWLNDHIFIFVTRFLQKMSIGRSKRS